jgi:hypothetical protein
MHKICVFSPEYIHRYIHKFLLKYFFIGQYIYLSFQHTSHKVINTKQHYYVFPKNLIPWRDSNPGLLFWGALTNQCEEMLDKKTDTFSSHKVLDRMEYLHRQSNLITNTRLYVVGKLCTAQDRISGFEPSMLGSSCRCGDHRAVAFHVLSTPGEAQWTQVFNCRR